MAVLAASVDLVGLDQCAVQVDVRPAFTAGSLEDLVQVRGVAGEHVDALVEVPVGGGDADPGVTGKQSHRGVGAEPAQHQDGLPVAAQDPAALAGADPAAVSGQPPRQLLDGTDGNVERGTMGNHVGSSRMMVWILVETDPRPQAPRSFLRHTLRVRDLQNSTERD
jgi:hypothetical protein